jgi:polyisoprenoid-binding protein YceI
MRHPSAPRPAQSCLAVVLVLAAAGAAQAAPETYVIDAVHSSVAFSVRHFTSKVPGRFNKFEGTIVVDPKDLATTQIDVSIDVASIDTAIADRDGHLKSPDFFDVAKHPKATFKSTKVTPAGPGRAKIEGTLTLRGVSKPVVLEAEVLGFGPGMGGHWVGGFEAKGRINRQDFGVAWNKAIEGGGLVLSNDVDLVINVEAGRKDPKPAEGAKQTGR